MSMEKDKENLKERLLKARALSDDELEQVAGGFTIFPMCAKCGAFHPADQPCAKPLI